MSGTSCLTWRELEDPKTRGKISLTCHEEV